LGTDTHTCNSSYSGGWDKSLRPAWAKLVRTYLKNKIEKENQTELCVCLKWQSTIPKTANKQKTGKN
jgi:hypothetical protein